MAKEFDLTKATISDSVKVLLAKEMLIKLPDTYDFRSYTVRLTQKGRKIAEQTQSFTSSLENAIQSIDEQQRGVFLQNLLHIILDLNKSHVISTQRMCLSCHNYERKNNEHYCRLLKSKLNNEDLRVDCVDHKV